MTRRLPLPSSLSLLLALALTLVLASSPLHADPAPAEPAAVAGEVRADPASEVTYAAAVTDPDDTAGPLDVAQVTHTVRTDERAQRARITFGVRTYRGFDAGALDPHRRSLVIELDTDGESGAERNLRISARDGEPVAELISNATRTVLAVLPTARPDRHTVSVSGARRWLGARRYFWTVTYHRHGSVQCGRSGDYPAWCQDSVPERGWVRMDRPAWPDQ